MTTPATSASTPRQSRKKAFSLAKSIEPSSGRGTFSGRSPPLTHFRGTSTLSNISAKASVASDR